MDEHVNDQAFQPDAQYHSSLKLVLSKSTNIKEIEFGKYVQSTWTNCDIICPLLTNIYD